MGFAEPAGHPTAGGLLPRHFTLTPKGGIFLLHFPSLPLDDNARALPGLLSCGVRTFLTPCKAGSRGDPVHPLTGRMLNLISKSSVNAKIRNDFPQLDSDVLEPGPVTTQSQICLHPFLRGRMTKLTL